jgi:hypothetical protein
MKNFLESNLSLLEAYDPTTANAIRHHERSNAVEILTTEEGQLSLKYSIAGKEYLLHSAKAPRKEAERWSAGLPTKPVYNLIVFGCGMVHHLYQLIVKYHATLKSYVIVESEMDIVHSAFSLMDLSPLLRTKATFFHIAGGDSDLRRLLNRQLTPYTLDGVEVVEHPASIQLNPDYYRRCKEVIDESLQSGEILLRTKVELGGMIQENVVRNLPHVLNSPNVSALSHCFANVPAFVVGAGPSLDKNIDILTQVGDRGVIIAVDTIYKKLLRCGIVPDLLVSTDPTYLNMRHFEGVHDLHETVFVFSPSVYYPILEQLTCTKVSIPLVGSRFMATLRDVFGNVPTIKTGVNVGQTCFNLARFLGCGPIILTGLDFSFSPNGGMTHASDTALRRQIFVSDTPGKMKVELIGDPTLEEFDPIYIPGSCEPRVATNKFWLAYLRSMEEEIKQTEVKVLNCTEGGALIEGADSCGLSDAIAQYCVGDQMVKNTLQMAVGFFFAMHQEEGKAVLNHSVTILTVALEHAARGEKLVDDLKILFDAGAPPEDQNAKLDEIAKAHEAVVQNQMIYVVLDEAADKVLKPFLKQSARMVGEEPTQENVQRALARYHPYFHGMKNLCEHFKSVFEETLEKINDQTSPGTLF